MKNENHLPIYGVGPFLVTPILITALVALILTICRLIPNYMINSDLLIILGVMIIVCGLIFWVGAVTSRIDDKIRNNKLETTGVYGIIRHPIYAAFLYISTGIIVISSNVYLFIFPLFYWAFLSVALKNTEEKWLADLYGGDYIDYSKKVNRFIPRMVK